MKKLFDDTCVITCQIPDVWGTHLTSLCLQKTQLRWHHSRRRSSGMPYMPCWARHFVDTKFGPLLFAELVGGKWEEKKYGGFFPNIPRDVCAKVCRCRYTKNTWNILKLSFDNLSLHPCCSKMTCKICNSHGGYSSKNAAHTLHMITKIVTQHVPKKQGSNLMLLTSEILGRLQLAPNQRIFMTNQFHGAELVVGSGMVNNYCWWRISCTSWYGKYLIIYKVSYMRKIFLHHQYVISKLNPCACCFHMFARY